MPEDIYRDTPVRYLGYANEVGEAFRAFIGSKAVLATYGVATAYVLADTYDKTKKCANKFTIDPSRKKKVIFAAVDTLTWQMLASVMIPGFTINRLCALTGFVLKKTASLPKNARKAVVTAVGLGAIPFIIHPIDNFTHQLLDQTLRKFQP